MAEWLLLPKQLPCSKGVAWNCLKSCMPQKSCTHTSNNPALHLQAGCYQAHVGRMQTIYAA